MSESDRLARLEGGEPAILGRDLRRVLRLPLKKIDPLLEHSHKERKELTIAPLNAGWAPEELVMSKLSVSSSFRMDSGSLRETYQLGVAVYEPGQAYFKTRRTSLPVLVRVVEIFNSWTPLKEAGADTPMLRPGAAAALEAKTRAAATRDAKGNMAMR